LAQSLPLRKSLVPIHLQPLEEKMNATILHLDPDVAAKFRNAKIMLVECRTRMPNDPKAALDFAQASARIVAEALSLAHERAPVGDA
jgi:hypothetical protein